MTPPILLLPGHMCDRRLWALVEPDLRGLGYELEHGDLTVGCTIEEIARRILEAAPARFVAAGLSMGGIVAFELIRQAPDRVLGLILSDTNAAPEPAHREANRRRQQDRVRAGELRSVVRDELKPAYIAMENRQRHDILDLTLAMALDLGPEVFLRQSDALISRPDSRPLLARLACPTLVLCGKDDPICPPEWHEDMARQIPGAELKLIKHAGHLPPLEQPLSFVTAILEWTNRQNQEHQWTVAATAS
jgi:pimeloyl-ACP methyl ester carboxylesterase